MRCMYETQSCLVCRSSDGYLKHIPSFNEWLEQMNFSTPRTYNASPFVMKTSDCQYGKNRFGQLMRPCSVQSKSSMPLIFCTQNTIIIFFTRTWNRAGKCASSVAPGLIAQDMMGPCAGVPRALAIYAALVFLSRRQWPRTLVRPCFVRRGRLLRSTCGVSQFISGSLIIALLRARLPSRGPP